MVVTQRSPAFVPMQFHHRLGEGIRHLEKSTKDTLLHKVARIAGCRLLVLAQVFAFAANALANAVCALRGRHSFRYLKASSANLLKIIALPAALLMPKIYFPSFNGESSTHLLISTPNGKLLEMNKRELTAELLMKKYPSLSKKQIEQFAKDRHVQHVLFFYLNPYKEANPSEKEFNDRIEKLIASQASPITEEIHCKKFVDLLRRDLDNLGIEKVVYNKEWMKTNLQPGDIMICRYFHGAKRGLIDGAIYGLQTLHEMGVDGKREKESTFNGHVAIYIGEGKIAEASIGGGHDIRILDVDHEQVKIEKGMQFEWVVVRPKDSSFAQRVAQLATQYADTEEEVMANNGKSEARYAFLTGMRALYHNTLFRNGAKGMLIKEYYDQLRGENKPTHVMKGKRDFYCSEFASYVLQSAEANQVLPKILTEEDRVAEDANTLQAGLKARRMARKYADELDQQIQMQYDPKWMTPVKFRQFVIQHPELFEDLYRLVPPN